MAVLTLVLTLGASTAWADDWGFYQNNSSEVWSVQIGYNGTNWRQHGDREGDNRYSGDANLGVVTTDIWLDNYSAWCWGGSTTRYVRMYSALKYNSGDFTGFTEEYSQAWNTTGNEKIKTSDSNTKKLYTYSELSAGDYQYKYYLQITSDAGSTSDAQRYCSNSGSNMWVYFTIPGFITESQDASIGSIKQGNNTSKKITFTHYGTAPTTGNCVRTGKDKDLFSVTSIDNTGVTVKFTAGAATPLGEKRATLTITDSYGKTHTINLTANVRSATDPVVKIAAEPEVERGPKVTLSGYLQKNGCDFSIKEYGFVYATTSNPTISNNVVKITSETSLPAGGAPFTRTFSASDAGTALAAGTTYHYRAYVKSEGSGEYYYSDDDTFKIPAAADVACKFSVGDTIYYTIDNTQPEDPCELRFHTLANAIADAKKTHTGTGGETIPKWIDNSNYNKVQKPIIFEVAPGTYGNEDNSTRVDLSNINGYAASYSAPSYAPTSRLIIRAQDPTDKPIFKGGLDMLRSRYITLKNLIITRETSTSDHSGSAVEFGYYGDGNAPNIQTPGVFSNTNIELIGCEIDATAFNCVHAVGCNGLKFEECVFDLEGVSTEENDMYWGASVKLMCCNSVQFTRNSLRGSHSTTLWLQSVQDALVMNNVFWNDNLFSNNVAFVRPMVFATDGTPHQVSNIAIYYNTFYLADHASSAYKVDFLRFGGPSTTNTSSQAGRETSYKEDVIQFKWNNCYSYDDKIYQRNEDATAFLGKNLTTGTHKANYAYNNFWSKCSLDDPTNENAHSGLYFGPDDKHIDVESQVCKSTADDPDELVLNGSKLNIGARPSSDISNLGIANTVFADRNNALIRSEAGGDWSYGAFQQAPIAEVDTIIWAGGKSGAWDLRSNWTNKYGKKLNCASFFSRNLHVIIPNAKDLENIPEIPSWSDTGTRGTYPAEYVAAALGMQPFEKTSQFARGITIEAGGAIIGVENLKEGSTLHYHHGRNSLTALRKQWILVGGVIKNFRNEGEPSVISNDFYIADHLPHVYMQHFERSGDDIVPGTPFTSLSETVDPISAFGIYIPDQYGPYKLPAKIYYQYYDNDPSKLTDGDAPKTFNFEGRFANEDAMPTYSLTTKDTWYFVNNSYPANLNVAKLLDRKSSDGLQAKVYSYKYKSWDDVDASSVEANAVYVTPNNGFVLYSNTTSNVSVTTTHDDYGKKGGSTNYIDYLDLKRAYANTYLKLRVQNTVDGTASMVNVRYNAENLNKAFSYNESTPEIYIPSGDAKYSTYGIDDEATVIPLSLRNKQSKNLNVQFTLAASDGFESIVLEDRVEGKTYDLTDGDAPYFNGIAPGDCAGRFYLILNYADEQHDVPTSVDDVNSTTAGSGIDIYAIGHRLTVSVSQDLNIEKIMLFDMAGRAYSVPVTGAKISQTVLGVENGVYTVKVIADKMTRTEKVILK